MLCQGAVVEADSYDTQIAEPVMQICLPI